MPNKKSQIQNLDQRRVIVDDKCIYKCAGAEKYEDVLIVFSQ